MKCLLDKTEIESFHIFENRALFNKPINSPNLSAVADMKLGYNQNTGHISSSLDAKVDIGELTKKIYEELYSGYAPVGLSSLQKSYTDYMANWLLKTIPHRSKILEIGCHDGYLLNKMQEAGHVCAGIEPSPYADYARDTYGLDVIKSFFDYGIYEDEFFDVVIVRHVVEHVPDPVNFLKNVTKSLKYDGLIYVEVPNSMWCLENSFFPEFHVDHISYFSLNSLKYLMKEAGIGRILHAESFNAYMRFPFNACLGKKSLDIEKVVKTGYISNFRIDKLTENFVKNYKTYISNLKKLKYDGKLAVWGSGSIGTQYAIDGEWDLDDDIYYVDPNKDSLNKKLSVTGHQIHEIDRLNKDVPKTVLIASGWEDDVKRQAQSFIKKDTQIKTFKDLLI